MKKEAMEYVKMTPKEKILKNIEGIEKELQANNITSDCVNRKVYCIECALQEIRNNLNKLVEIPENGDNS